MSYHKHGFWHKVFKSVLIYLVVEFVLHSVHYWLRRRVRYKIRRHLH
jgi:hypothetical protein